MARYIIIGPHGSGKHDLARYLKESSLVVRDHSQLTRDALDDATMVFTNVCGREFRVEPVSASAAVCNIVVAPDGSYSAAPKVVTLAPRWGVVAVSRLGWIFDKVIQAWSASAEK